MLSVRNGLNMLKMLQIKQNSQVDSSKSKNSVFDCSNPANREMAERLKVQFSGLKKQAEDREVMRAIRKEFGKDMPALEGMVKERLFSRSANQPKLLEIG